LGEAHAGALLLNGEGIALILGTRDFAASHQKLALLVIDVGNGASDGSAIHVHIEDVQEDADAGGGGIIVAYGDDFSVGRGNGYGSVRNYSIGIAKKIETEGGQKEEAIAAYKKAIDVNPYYSGHHIDLENAYFSLGDTEKALEEAKRVTELQPDSVHGWDNLGNAYERADKFDESVAAYQKSIVLSPTWSAYSNLGNIYFVHKRYDDAVKAFEKATELGPNQELAMGNLADAYRASGQKDKAMATYDKAIALAFQDLQVNPQNTGAMEDLAMYFAKKGDAKHGMEFIQRARGIDKKDVGLIYAQATVENLAGKTTDALRTLREAFSKGYPVKDAAADPELENLQGFPEFQAMIKQFGSSSQ